jgi:hypothetical protein
VRRLDHEPTPESVGQAQTYAQLSFAAELAQAKAQDALGHEPDCLLAARRAFMLCARQSIVSYLLMNGSGTGNIGRQAATARGF